MVHEFCDSHRDRGDSQALEPAQKCGFPCVLTDRVFRALAGGKRPWIPRKPRRTWSKGLQNRADLAGGSPRHSRHTRHDPDVGACGAYVVRGVFGRFWPGGRV